MKSELQAIDRALTSGDELTAFSHAVAAWRTTRDPSLAELACTLAARIEQKQRWTRAPKDDQRPWRTGMANKERLHSTWLAIAATHDPRALGALLEKLTASCPNHASPSRYRFAKDRFGTFIERVSALTKFDDDPRMTAALLRVLKSTPFTSADTATGPSVYEPVIALLERLRDSRCLPELESLVEQPTTKSVNLRGYFAERLPRAIESIRSHAGSTAAVEAELDALLVRVGRPKARRPSTATSTKASDGDLLDAVVAVVGHGEEDHGAWEVLADHYLERADPRGELISLMLAADRDALDVDGEKRLRALFRREKEWLPKEVALTTKNRAYRRGLLESFDLLAQSATTSATVRYCGQGSASEPLFLRFVTSEAMRSLSTVAVKSAHALDTVAKSALLASRLKELRVAFVPTRANLNALTRARFPTLRRLTIIPRRAYDLEELVEVLMGWTNRPTFTELTLADWDRPDFLLTAERFPGVTVSIETDWFEMGFSDSNPRVAVCCVPEAKKTIIELDVRMSGDEEIVWSSVTTVAKSMRVDRVTFHDTGDRSVQLSTIARQALDVLRVRQTALPATWRRD